MSAAIPVDTTATNVPLHLTVSKDGTGGVTGLTPTVALRDGSTLNSYLDWDDDTFKTSGWTTKYATLSEVERGHYQRTLSMVDIGATAGKFYMAEYRVNDGSGTADAMDILIVTSVVSQVDLQDQQILNRLEEAPGNPGTLILYARDGTTPLKTWNLRDSGGGPTTASAGAPSRRSAAT